MAALSQESSTPSSQEKQDIYISSRDEEGGILTFVIGSGGKILLTVD